MDQDLLNKIIETLSGFDKKFDSIEKRLEGFDKKLSAIETKVDIVDKRLVLIDERIKSMEAFVPVDNAHLGGYQKP
jgi:archaellum component FlaC